MCAAPRFIGMKTKLNNLRDKVVASYWFVPAILGTGAVAAASAALRLDRGSTGVSPQSRFGWIGVNTAEGARELVSTIASSTITVAGVIFSITILALSFASSQYGPRLLRNFMRDRLSQFVLGAFISTYLYCLLVLRTIGPGATPAQLPHVAIAGALVLGVASMALLIFYIHHVARTLQISSLVDAVGRDMIALIREFERLAHRPRPASPASPGTLQTSFSQVVESDAHGYVQALANEDLLETALAMQGRVQLHVAPGDYVSSGLPLATLQTGSSEHADGLTARVRQAIVIGTQRTNEQDIEFPIDQLAEIAVRALSPGFNDPFTAILCINRLGASIDLLARFRWPASSVCDERGCDRVLLLPLTMLRLLRRAFSQILHYGGSNPAIVRQVMKMLSQAAERAHPDHLIAFNTYADEVLEQLAPPQVVARVPELQERRERIRERNAPRVDNPRS